ncbi:MAG: hypothetical protein U5L02_09655 [Rheinheimera sp.]|nr:hypothetical protein [Rheinheimera sp.]
MKNFVIMDSSLSLGGAETFNARFIKYLSKESSNRVVLLTVPGGTVKSLLEDNDVDVEVFYIPDAWTFNVSPRSRDMLYELGREIRGVLNGKVFVLCCYIENLHKAMYMFDGQSDVSLLSGILHPEAWSLWHPDSGFDASNSFGPRQVDELWHYKRRLLKELDSHKALWYPNDIYRRYNEYYFDIDMKHQASATVPVELPEAKFKYQPMIFLNVLRIVWLGRFDFFKNASIRAFIEGIREVIKDSSICVQIDLIGYGEAKYEHELRELSVPKEIDLNFIGKLSEADIQILLCKNQYHFGFGMGSSAYHLAAIGLPVLAIDSAVKGYEKWVKACWLCDASDEFDEGSSLYLNLIGEASGNRQQLAEIIQNIISDADSLNYIGRKCQDYVRKYHDVDTIMGKISGFMMNSTFNKKLVYEPSNVIADSFFYLVNPRLSDVTIAVFGTGAASFGWCNLVDSHNDRNPNKIKVAYFFDNNSAKHGSYVDGKLVLPVSVELCNSVDIIVLASEYWHQMQKQILDIGVEEGNKIFRAL